MATRKTLTTTETPVRTDLLARLGIDPKSDTGKWVAQQQDAGVRDVDILAGLAGGTVAPSPFKPREHA